MSVTTVVCACGCRLKVRGLAPGKTAVCPGCGRRIRATSAASAPGPAVPAAPVEEDEWNWHGDYELVPLKAQPAREPAPPEWPDELATAVPEQAEPPQAPLRQRPAPATPGPQAAAEDEWNWQGTYDVMPQEPPSAPEASDAPSMKGDAAAVVDRAKDTLSGDQPDAAARRKPWFPPGLLYPLRAAEGVGMAIALGTIFWVMGTLVPEYCLAVNTTAEQEGAAILGRFMAFLWSLPMMLLMPPVLLFWTAYLTRVLRSSAAGEMLPPRLPKVHFDGLLTGLVQWLIWLVAGLGVGMLPLVGYAVAALRGAPWSPGAAAGMALFALLYSLMALLIVFPHENPLGATPWGVIAATVRLGPSFLGLYLTIATMIAVSAGAFVATFALRSKYFWPYLAVSLPCWLFAVWTSITVMHTLGCFYDSYQSRFRRKRKRKRKNPSA